MFDFPVVLVVLVSTTAVCALAGYAGYNAPRLCSSWLSQAKFCLAVMDQKDSGSVIYYAGFAGDNAPRAVFLGLQAHDARHHGRYGPEGLCRGAEAYPHGRDSPVAVHLVVDVPVVFFNIPVVALRPSPKVQTPLRTVFPQMHVEAQVVQVVRVPQVPSW